MKTRVRLLALVFGTWTLIAVLSTLANIAFMAAVGRTPHVGAMLRHALTEQWIWALLTPLAFMVADRAPITRARLGSALAVHVVAFLVLSFVHCAIFEAVGDPFTLSAGTWTGPHLVLRFLADFYSDIWMYWPLVGIRMLMNAQARERDRERQAARLEQSMSDLKLSLLRAQIQPHFLFNTLHAISALLRTDPRAAEDMVADLAEILRASFAEPASQTAPLLRELELVACYLRIQQRRLGDRLSVRWQVAPDAVGAAVPALVLSSLVENAIVHGIAPITRACTLQIVAEREGEMLRLAVRDDGAGMPADPHRGVGLANARERLAQLHGERQRFAIDSTPGRGTAVEMRMPFLRAGDDRGAGNDDDIDDPHADRGRRAAGAAEPVVPA